jgi:hypothetical protein
MDLLSKAAGFKFKSGRRAILPLLSVSSLSIQKGKGREVTSSLLIMMSSRVIRSSVLVVNRSFRRSLSVNSTPEPPLTALINGGGVVGGIVLVGESSSEFADDRNALAV